MTIVTICYSRCLYCGRQTPHETCHQHSEELNPGWYRRLEATYPEGEDLSVILWRKGFDRAPDPCEDGACPVWEPGEWDRIQAERAMTPEQRAERLASIQCGIEERRAEYDRVTADRPPRARGDEEGG